MINLFIYIKVGLWMLMFFPFIFSLVVKKIHPLTYMLKLIFFTMIMTLKLFLNSMNSLYSMMMLISLIGGMMIMFMYFVSLLNNDNQFVKSFEYMLLLFFYIFMCFITFYFINNTFLYECMFNNNNNNDLNMNFELYKVYLYPFYLLTIIMIFMLFNCLFICTKICSYKYKALRKMKND